MNMVFDLVKANDIDELEQLYNDLNDHLGKGVNYPGWIKDVYPVRQDAIDGVKHGNLYVSKYNGKIIGSIILNHEPEPAYYKQSSWFQVEFFSPSET